MSNEGELTLEDFMIHFGSVLSQNFGELRGMLVTQAVKLQKLENMIKDLKKRQEGYVETPEEQVVPEEQFAKDLKQENKHPATSTPKRGSVDADLDEEEVSPYGESISVVLSAILINLFPRNSLLRLQAIVHPR